MTYEYTDKMIAYMDKQLIKRYSRLKSLVSFDELNVLNEVNTLYRELYEIIKKSFLILANQVYSHTTQRKSYRDLDEEWIDYLLTGYDPVSKYVFAHEIDRKCARLIEAVISSDTKAQEIDAALDEAPRKLEVITLAALDRMVLFDKPVDMGLLSFPMTVSNLLSRICDICNVTLGTNTTTLPNHDYVIQTAPTTEDLTYRQLLSWIAELTGTCGFIDWDGHLILKWYSSTDTVIDLKNRFSSDLEENAVEITGVQVVTDEETYLVGDDGYAFNIEGNELVQHDYRAVAQALYNVLGGFTYTPFSATIKPMPHLYPLDVITFLDKTGGEHTTIITDYTFSLNTSTSIEGKGETATKSGYASANPLTKKESAIIKSLQQGQNEALNDRVQTVLAFNELICNAMGLYETPVAQEDGSVIYYLHNKPNLEESETIFTMTAAGIAWTTTGWNNGSPVWSYGVTAAGDALFRLLSAEGIEVSKVGEDYNIEITPKAFRIYYRDMLVTNIEADEMNIPKAFFTTYAQCGRVRLIPYGDTGTNLVFLD